MGGGVSDVDDGRFEELFEPLLAVFAESGLDHGVVVAFVFESVAWYSSLIPAGLIYYLFMTPVPSSLRRYAETEGYGVGRGELGGAFSAQRKEGSQA